jgi:hypothetical protein
MPLPGAYPKGVLGYPLGFELWVELRQYNKGKGGFGHGPSESAETMWSVFDQFVMLTVAFRGPLESRLVPNVRHYQWLFDL